MMTTPALQRAAVLLALIALTLTGCGAKHRLDQYDFAGRTVAIMPFSAPVPDLMTRPYPPTGGDAISTIISAGTRIAVEVEAREARARLDTAATRVDLVGMITERTLQRASAYLGARSTNDRDNADFLIDLSIRSIAIDVGGSNAALVLDSEAVLLERATGREVWKAHVRNREPVTPSAGFNAGGDAVTAIVLSTVTVDEFQRLLESSAVLTADMIMRRLRDDLEEVRAQS